MLFKPKIGPGYGSTETLRRDSLCLTTKFWGVPVALFIELGFMKSWVDLGSPTPLDWEPSTLTTNQNQNKILPKDFRQKIILVLYFKTGRSSDLAISVLYFSHCHKLMGFHSFQEFNQTLNNQH